MINVPCQCVILQCTYQCCLVYVVISDSCASHIVFTTNQNWYFSLFPTPLNTDNIIVLTILNCGGGGGGVGGHGGEDSEIGGGVGGGGMHRIRFLIRLIALLGETFVSSSSLSR